MTTAIILAAGEGLRAWPFSGVRQKVTVPVANVPLVRRIAEDLAALGVADIAVVVGHRAAAVRACLVGVHGVRFVEQRGGKGPVPAALTGLDGCDSDMALVCCGDIATPRENLKALLDAYASNRVAAAVLVADCPAGLTASRTTVEHTSDGIVKAVYPRGSLEKPRFGGVIAAGADDLRRYFARDPGLSDNAGVGSMPPEEGNLAHAIELMRREGLEVLAVPAQGYFVDVDKPWHIVEANRKAAQHFLDGLDATVICEGASIDDGADIPGDARLWLGPRARIGKGCHLEGNAMLGEGAQVVTGAILGANVTVGAHTRCEHYALVGSNAVLGERCVISHDAEFSGVAFDVVYLYHYCSMSACIGSHVDIGAATVCGTWRFDDGVRTQNVLGRKETPECYGSCTFIGDHSRTGVNVMFMPGVRVGYYSCVGAGALVYDDVPERSLLIARQEHVIKPWGPEKYDW